MPGESESVPDAALKDVAYLSRSANRIEILESLRERPGSRRDLAERTDTSRTTLDRIVNELEERGWAERTTDGAYVATAAGAHLMAQFTPFIEAVAAVRRLGEAVAWLPTDDLSIGLEHFSDASVLRPEHDDPVETVDYMLDLFQETTSFRGLTHFAPPAPLSNAMRDRIAAGRMTAEFVLTDDLIDYLRDQPERRTRWRDILNWEAEVFQVQGPIPCNLWIFDDRILIKKSGPEGVQETYGVPIVSENETVQSWAHDLIDQWRSEATPVDISTFLEEPTVPQAETTDE